MSESMKLNFVTKCKTSYCQACLCDDRRLSPINGYVDIINKICDIPNVCGSSTLLLCWECMAALRNIILFKLKVEKAQMILTHIGKEEIIPNSLSRLTKTYTDDAIFITYDEEIKPNLDIKQEIDQIDDHLDNFEQLGDDYLSQDIKKEIKRNPKRIIKHNLKKEKKTSKPHYRIVYEPGVSKKSLLRKKFDIKESEIVLWLEREKSSGFYRKFKYKCKYCLQGWKLQEKLEAHNTKYHNESIGPHTCDICNCRFDSQVSQSAHIKSHYIGFECTHCAHQCYTARRLNAHLDTHRKVQCVYCEGCFSNIPQFYKHYKYLHSVFLCDHCGKRCKSKHMLEKHMRHHSDSHTCNACHQQYKSLAALRKHISMKHRSTLAEQAYCVLCDKQYESEFVYKRHVQSSAAHSHERDLARAKKSISCPECGNTYSRRTYMMNHYRHVHMNQSKYHCRECDRHFLNRTKYMDHVKYKHDGVKKEKNKLCNICGKGFATNRILLNHTRTHSGERPYECESCGAKFTQKHSMVSHIKYIHLKSSRRSLCD